MRLVFVHGFGCSADDWSAQRAALAPQHEVITPDLPGHGQTPGTPRDASITHFSREVEQLLVKPSLLIGHSMGCRVVLEAARRNPDSVAGLVLVDASRISAAADPIDSLGYARFIDTFFAGMIFKPLPQGDALIARAKRMPADFGTALFHDIVRWDAAELDAALAAVRAPLLAIQSTAMNAGRKRVMLRAGESSPWLDLLRQRLPGARIEVIPGVGHFTQIEAAGEVSRLIGDFAARASQRR